MSEKASIKVTSAYRLLHPMHTILVTCIGKKGKINIIPLAWAMPASHNPPLIAISISPKRYSYDLILETGEFVINIPTIDIIKETLTCGRTTGRNLDKFSATNLTASPAKKVKAPLIKECIAHLECKLHGKFRVGDHFILVGKIIEASANKGIFEDMYDVEKAPLLYHVGGNVFATLNPDTYKL